MRHAVRPPGCNDSADAEQTVKKGIMSARPAPYERFLADVSVRAGFSSADQSEAAAQAVIAVVAALVPLAVRHDMKEALPEELAKVVDGSQELPLPADADAFYSAVASSEHVPIGFAKEHAGVVCQALRELLSNETLSRIRSALGLPLAAIFRPRERYAAAPPKKVARAWPDDRRTLSSGRPGGMHPLSEASGVPNDDTLGRGRPGGKHPLSESRPGGKHPLSESRPGGRHPLSEAGSAAGPGHRDDVDT